MLRTRVKTITTSSMFLPMYLDSLNYTIFLEIMQRNYIWLGKKPKKRKNTIFALIEKEIGVTMMERIFRDKYPEISDMLICEHRMNIAKDRLDVSRYSKFLECLDNDMLKRTELRGQKLDSGYNGKIIRSLIDGNQRSTTLLLLFKGVLKNAGITYYPAMKLCEIDIENGNNTREESIELIMDTDNKFFFYNEIDGKLICYIHLDYLYKRWQAEQKDPSTSFNKIVKDEIEKLLNDKAVDHLTNNVDSIVQILNDLYYLFTTFEIRMTIYDNPSFDESCDLFMIRNSGIVVDNRDTIFAKLVRESYYGGDARTKFNETTEKINARFNTNYTVDNIFSTMYYIANRIENDHTKCPASLNELNKYYDKDVHAELSDNYQFYENVLIKTCEIINNRNLETILPSGKSQVLFRIICRRVRKLMDINSSATVWCNSHPDYQDLILEIRNFVNRAKVHNFEKKTSNYNPFAFHIEEGKKLDDHVNLPWLTKQEVEQLVTTKKDDLVSKMIIANTSPVPPKETNDNGIKHSDHIFPKSEVRKRFTNKVEDLVCNRLLLSGKENTTKQALLPAEFFKGRTERNKELSKYIFGIKEDGTVDPILSDIDNYDKWVVEQQKLVVKNLEGILWK